MLVRGALALLVLPLLAPNVCATEGRPDPTTLLTAPLLPEGSSPDAPGTFKLEDVDKPLAVDLQWERTIRGLLLQADGNDIYFVDACNDGISWRTVWRASRYGGMPGLRTRTTTLPEPIRARFLRIRPTLGDGVFSVSRLRFYETLPSPWPPTLDETRSRLPLLPSLTPELLVQLRHGIAGLALAALAWKAGRSKTEGTYRWWRVALGTITLLSALSFWNFLNFHHYDGLVHLWDAYHYYVGAKYFPEIGYTELYECSAVAEVDDGRAEQVGQRSMRDLATNQVVSARRAVERPEPCHAAFSTERWASFRRDVRFFREAMGEDSWRGSQTDHGFNATPVWILAGRILTNPTTASMGVMVLLSLVDVLLLLLGWGLMRWAFGFEPACVATIYFGLNAFARFAWTGGALLRYDWLFWAVASVCLLRRQHRFAAGFALAYSAALRIFPAFLVVGLALGPLAKVARLRTLAPLIPYRRTAAGFLVALCSLVTLSVTATGRPRAWTEFAENTRRFLSTDAQNFVGLPVLGAFRPSLRQEMAFDPLEVDPLSGWVRSQAEARARSAPFLAVAGLIYLAILAAASPRLPDWANAILGMGLVTVVLRSANYYYSWLLLYGLLAELCPPVGLGLTAVAWASDLAAGAWPFYDERAVALSALALLFVVAVLMLLSTRSATKALQDEP